MRFIGVNMKKLLLICLMLGLSNGSSIGAVSFAVERESVLPVIEPPPLNSCEQTQKVEFKDAVKVNNYDNVQIFNKDNNRKVNIMLKQPNATTLGTQQ